MAVQLDAPACTRRPLGTRDDIPWGTFLGAGFIQSLAAATGTELALPPLSPNAPFQFEARLPGGQRSVTTPKMGDRTLCRSVTYDVECR